MNNELLKIKMSDDLPTKVAKIRFHIVGTALDFNNVLNQLHIRSNEKAEERGKKLTLEMFNDILPRIIDNFDEKMYELKKQREEA